MNLEIDRLCVEFEDKLKSGEVPRIEDYLERIDRPHREQLLTELLLLKFEYRDTTSPNEYIERFPQFEEVVRKTFDSQASLQRTELKAGDKVGRYEVCELLGTGNFGWVYRGRDDELDRDVALKVPRLSESATGATAEAFCREAQSLAKLRHRNILGIHDIVRDEHGWPILVLEYLQGKPLSEHEAEVNEQTIDWLVQVCEGLTYAHREGVVHRDLKPENVFIDHTGRAVLVDFGLSLQHESKAERSGESAGTLKYMSPEQVRGEAHWMDGRADIWSIGVMLYQLLSGKLPFNGDTPQELSQAILEQPARPPRQFAQSVDPQLETICLKCLEKSPNARYATAADLANELKRFSGRSGKRSIIRPLAIASIVTLSGLLVWSMRSTTAERTEAPGAPNQPQVPDATNDSKVSNAAAKSNPLALASFNFEQSMEPWLPYASAELRLSNENAIGEACLEITDRFDHQDGPKCEFTNEVQDGGHYWFSANLKSLAEPLYLQLQMELERSGNTNQYPNIRHGQVNDSWTELAGGLWLPPNLSRATLIIRSNRRSIAPFSLDNFELLRLEEVSDSEKVRNGSFDASNILQKSDAGTATLMRTRAADGDWVLSLTERQGVDSGITSTFEGEPGRFYLCSARVRTVKPDLELRLQMKRLREGQPADYSGLQRAIVTRADEWLTLEEIYRVPAEDEGSSRLVFGVYSIDHEEDFDVDDMSVREMRIVEP